jgi:hypothetical protein
MRSNGVILRIRITVQRLPAPFGESADFQVAEAAQ